MREIIIPLIDFEDASLEEAVDFLRIRSVDCDPDRDMPGVGPIVINKSAQQDDAGTRRITRLQMKNVSLWDALQRVAGETRTKVVITDRAIELMPR